LLKEHYVEDHDGVFRFEYSTDFLNWALCVPGYIKDWHVGVKSTSNGKLLAFISGTPVKTKVKDNTLKMAEINYLCVHKQLRQKKLAPVMIKEITRRVNLHNIW
jgi:glycylpeptide N-tetradecanoyltransferase